jgi:glycosyltransferase involved in cell wall biosynthesis
MRIIVFSPTLPLPFGTTDARWLSSMLDALSREGHEVSCLSSTEQTPEAVVEAADLAERKGYRLRHVPMRIEDHALIRKAKNLARPFSEYLMASGVTEALREESAGGVDVLHVEHLYPAWAALGHRRLVVYLHHLDAMDWEGRTDRTPRERFTHLQMQRATRRLLRRVPRLIAVSDRLEASAREVNPKLPTAVVPQALDIDLYPPLDPAPPVIGVIGSMHWYPSRNAAIRVLTAIWPEIRRRMPTAHLLVAGWNSERYLGQYFPLEGARLLGEVAHPSDFFRRIGVLVYPPPQGTGMKIKVMEAMAYGLPVVSNHEGLEGLDYHDGVDVVCAETDDELVDRTLELLADPGRRQALGRAARQLIGSSYTPRAVVHRLLEAYDRLLHL